MHHSLPVTRPRHHLVHSLPSCGVSHPRRLETIQRNRVVVARGMAWDHASDDENIGGEEQDVSMERLERTKDYVQNMLFGGEWRDVHAVRQDRGVMSSSVNRGLSEVVTSLDTRDAMEACGGLEGDDKAECYLVFGVDRDADMWYDIVSRFDALLGLDTDPLEESVHRGQERV